MPNDLNSSSIISHVHSHNLPEFSPQNEKWPLFIERLEIHFCELECTSENTKKVILLKAIGTSVYTTLHALCSPSKPSSKTYKELCEILNTHFTHPSIIFRDRKAFHTAIMQDNEGVAEWFATVKRMALPCKFGPHLDEMVRDRLICELRDVRMFERICEEEETTPLQAILKKCMILETKFNENSQNMNHQLDQVNQITKQQAKFKNTKKAEVNHGKTDPKGSCRHCGWRNHQSSDCKYKDCKCHQCGKTGHLAAVCRAKQHYNSNKQNKRKYVNFVSTSVNTEMNSCYENLNSFICSVNDHKSNDLIVQIEIEGVVVEAMCDTGSPCILVPSSLCETFKNNKTLRSCKSKYLDYNTTSIDMLGEFNADISYKGVKKNLVVVVVKSGRALPIVGRSFLNAFNFKLEQVNLVNNVDQRFSNFMKPRPQNYFQKI